MNRRTKSFLPILLAFVFVVACGGGNANLLPEYPPFEPEITQTDETEPGATDEPREPPPESGE